MSREKAQEKIKEWFAGVTTPAFQAAADLTEVTVVVTRKKVPEITEPPPMPLAEVVKAMAQHQAAGFSPSTVVEV